MPRNYNTIIFERLVRAGVWRQWNKWVLPISIQASKKKEIASG
jgi:hypothetical protein